jgi:site-specific recombinase
MLQLLHMDVEKVDWDVAHVTYFASVYIVMLQAFVQNISSVLDICCSKCFI